MVKIEEVMEPDQSLMPGRQEHPVGWQAEWTDGAQEEAGPPEEVEAGSRWYPYPIIVLQVLLLQHLPQHNPLRSCRLSTCPPLTRVHHDIFRLLRVILLCH